MPESITESPRDHNEDAVKKNVQPLEANQYVDILANEPALPMQPLVVWTPRFISIFALVLVVGLSIASLLTQGWLNGYYQPGWPELVYDIVALGCWIAVIFFVRSLWVRLGALFAAIWAVFTAINLVVAMLIPIDRSAVLIGHATAARNFALLGCFICLSVVHIPFRRWDAWFFRLAPLIGGAAVVVSYLYTSPDLRTLYQLENHTTNVILYLCILVWWIRPSCWKAQPGLTFLLGAVPVMQRLLGIQFPHNIEPILFYTQVLLLLFALAAMRVIQYERKYAESAVTDQFPF